MPKQSKKQNMPKPQSGGKRKGRKDRLLIRVGPAHPRPRPRPRPRTTVVCNIM